MLDITVYSGILATKVGDIIATDPPKNQGFPENWHLFQEFPCGKKKKSLVKDGLLSYSYMGSSHLQITFSPYMTY